MTDKSKNKEQPNQSQQNVASPSKANQDQPPADANGAQPGQNDTRKLPLHIKLAERWLDSREQRGFDLRLVSDNDGHKHFWKYEDGLWGFIDDKEVGKWLEADLQAVLIDDLDQKRKATNKLSSEATKYIIRSAAIREPLKDFIDWDMHGKIPIKTGLIDPLTLKKEPMRKEHYCTSRLDIDYDRDAKCPKWEQLLADTFSDRTEQDRTTYIQMLQEFEGTSLISRRPKRLCRELLLLGPTDCGKTVLLNVLGGLISNNPITTPLKELGGTHGLQQFLRRGVPWVLHEAFDGGVWHLTSETKMIISCDPIPINPKYGKPITIRPNNPPMHATNHPPQWKDSSEAMVERMLIILFTKKFDRMNPTGVAAEARDEDPTWEPHDLILKHERTGLFNWALAGLKRALERGHYVNTESGEAALEEARKDSNIVKGFMPDCIDYDADVMISKVDFLAAVRKWFGEQYGDKKEGGPSPDMIGRHLVALNDPLIVQNKDKYKDRNGLRFYIGIKLNEGAGKEFFESCLTEEFGSTRIRTELARMSTSYKDTIRPIPAGWLGHVEIKELKARAKAAAEAKIKAKAKATGQA
jgi:energy-coupling factor transporter ATP-binding protein EcfA2